MKKKYSVGGTQVGAERVLGPQFSTSTTSPTETSRSQGGGARGVGRAASVQSQEALRSAPVPDQGTTARVKVLSELLQMPPSSLSEREYSNRLRALETMIKSLANQTRTIRAEQTRQHMQDLQKQPPAYGADSSTKGPLAFHTLKHTTSTSAKSPLSNVVVNGLAEQTGAPGGALLS
ncbi:unnamed protein product, partial [Amoebophrya sp. A25]|eukprot:GSA25T00025263001.1